MRKFFPWLWALVKSTVVIFLPKREPPAEPPKTTEKKP